MANYHKNLSKTHIIGKECKEQFLFLQAPEMKNLSERGLILAGVSELKPPYEIGRLNSQDMVLLATLSGEAFWQTETNQSSIQAGSTWLFPAKLNYRYKIKGNSWLMAWFHLKTDFGNLNTANPTQLHIQTESLFYTLKGIIHGGDETGTSSLIIREQYSNLLEAQLDKALNSNTPSAFHNENMRFSRLWLEVSSKLHYPWSVDKMAKMLHISEGHFHKIINDHYGCSPMQRLKTMRMEHAKMLLLKTDYTHALIAELIGYETPFAFSKAFKNSIGLSPRAWKIMINDQN